MMLWIIVDYYQLSISAIMSADNDDEDNIEDTEVEIV